MKYLKFILFSIVTLLISCVTPKNFVYFEDAKSDEKNIIAQTYDNRIQKDDVLAITVRSSTPELLAPFNLARQIDKEGYKSYNTSSEEDGYLVSAKGEILFPVLGKLHVEGLSHQELATLIEDKIIEGGYVNDPSVSVRLQNFKIAVLGEVKMPGLQRVKSERLSIFDALGLAGDMTIYGVRNKVAIIRELNGERTVTYVDVSSNDIFDSEYYYLKPNDVVYVTANKRQKQLSATNPALLPSILSAISVLSSILTSAIVLSR